MVLRPSRQLQEDDGSIDCKRCNNSGFVAYWDGSALAGEGCPDCTGNAMTTYEELEQEALNDPILHRFLTHYRRGDCSKEEALIAACIWLSRARRKLLKEEADRIARQPHG